MAPKLVGELKDKHLQCPYCGCLVDVPDEFESTTAREEKLADGTVRRVETSHRRRDLDDQAKAGRPIEAIVLNGSDIDVAGMPIDLEQIPGLKQINERLAKMQFVHWHDGSRIHARCLDEGKVIDQQVFSSRQEVESWMNEMVSKVSGNTESFTVLGSEGIELKVGEDGAVTFRPGAPGEMQAITRTVTTKTTSTSTDPIDVPAGLSASEARQYLANVERFSEARRSSRSAPSNNVLVLKWIFFCIVALIALVVVICIFR
jgi:hypothetical protein